MSDRIRTAALERLRACEVPEDVLEVTRKLRDAGHCAVLVGGVVRDAILGRPIVDFDIASSATPEEVMSVFRRTVPTGLAHGTVTVLTGSREHPRSVEVTTFRGEGLYADGRHPDQVEFLRDLDGDLARRDFTVNAMAWDPHTQELSDPFGGLADAAAQLLRAVGDPLERLREDGLRTMRAVRFSAVLDFQIEARTQAAIRGALDIFDRVSRERVRAELFKLLAADRPGSALHVMFEEGLWQRVFVRGDEAVIVEAIAAAQRLKPDPVLRLGRLCMFARGEPAELVRCFDGLRLSTAERERLEAITGDAAVSLIAAVDGPSIRRAARALGRRYVDDVLAVVEANPQVCSRVRTALEGAALTTAELAVRGGDLIRAGITPAGPAVGRLLSILLEDVLEHPELNQAPLLLERARSATATA